MKSISLLLTVLISSSCLFCEEVHVTYSKLLTSPSVNAQNEFVGTLDKPTEKLTELVIATLNDKEATIFSKVFALKVVAATAMKPALDACLPYVGTLKPGITNTQEKDLGAVALASIGKPADDRLLSNLTGTEGPETLTGITLVLLKLNSQDEAIKKVDMIIDDESRPVPVRERAKKIKEYLPLMRL